jgi:hypothetical protein
MNTWIIGDIHGMHESLLWLLGELPRDPNYIMVFLGEYLDRGPDVAGVVEAVLHKYDPHLSRSVWG